LVGYRTDTFDRACEFCLKFARGVCLYPVDETPIGIVIGQHFAGLAFRFIDQADIPAADIAVFVA